VATFRYSLDLGNISCERLLCVSGIGEILSPSDSLIDFLEAADLENADVLCLDDREANLEGTFDTGGKGGGSLKCEMDAVSVIFPGRFCLRYIPEHS